MITSPIKMLELANFGHMTTSTLQFESREKFFLVTSQPLFLNTFILRRSRISIFADIIKIVSMFIKWY